MLDMLEKLAYLKTAKEVAKHSSCLRRQVGAILVKNNVVIMSGYNYSPDGCKSCKSIGFCLRDQQNIASGTRHEICRAIHAEQACVARAGRCGVNIVDSHIYVTHSPCVICAKILIEAGIREINYLIEYPDQLAFTMLEEAHIKCYHVDPDQFKRR